MTRNRVNLLSNPTNATVNNDGTFTDDYTKTFDDLIITNTGPRVRSGSLYKYQQPWNDSDYIGAMLMGTNLLSPTHIGRSVYNISTNRGYRDLAKDIFMPNNGIFSNNFSKNHPILSTVGNLIIDSSIPLGINKLNKLNKLQNLKYLGVHGERQPGISQFAVSGKSIKNGTEIPTWVSNEEDYARVFADEIPSGMFDVYIPKKSNILTAPSPEKGYYYWWNDLPFTVKDGKLLKTGTVFRNTTILKDKAAGYKKYINHKLLDPDEEVSFISSDRFNPHRLQGREPRQHNTDAIARWALSKGYDGVTFPNIYDGYLIDKSGKLFYDIPVTNSVIFPGTLRYVLPHGLSKWKLYNKMDNTVPQFAFPTFNKTTE